MKTSKPISTISYNTEEFLKAKLDYMVRSGEVAFWYYIKHHGEYDKETNIQDKDHIHVYLEFADRVDTIKLGEMFLEYENGDLNSKPLKCMPFRVSKSYDALLYNIHHAQYLLQKFEQKEFAYTIDDIVTSDRDYLNQIYSEAMHSDIFKRDRMMKLMDSGVSVAEMCYHGLVNTNQAYQMMIFEQLYKRGKYSIDKAIKENRLLDLENPFLNVVDSALEKPKPRQTKKTARKKVNSHSVPVASAD